VCTQLRRVDTLSQRPLRFDIDQPVVIDLKRRSMIRVLPASVVIIPFGALVVYAVATGQVEGGIGVRVVSGVLGILCLGMGFLPLLFWKALTRSRQLIFDVAGVRLHDPQGHPFAVQWEELAAVTLSRTEQRRVRSTDFQRVMVRLDLFPGDDQFRARHPEMEHLWRAHASGHRYRLPLGDAPDLVPVIEAAVSRLRPQLWRGVHDEGFSVGLL
jgi:hypothetical protein